MVIEYTNKNGKTVKVKLISIEKKDLKDKNRLKIPEGITEIGRNALDYLRKKDVRNLQIKMPDTVTKIESQAFCCLHIKKIKLSENLKEIGEEAFLHTKFLSKVRIPDSVLHIPRGCFYESTFINGIELPQQLESIDWEAFKSTQIDELQIPDSVKSLGIESFLGSHIRKVKLSKNLVDIPEKSFSYTHNLEEIEIPHNVKGIQSQAFYQSSLKKILLHDGLQCIESDAFAFTKIEKITFPDTIYYIGNRSFQNCHTLRIVNFPLSLKYIGDDAFKNAQLMEVIFSSNVKIGSRAFQCNAIRKIQLTRDGYKQVKSRRNQAFKNNSELSEVYFYDRKTKYGNFGSLPKREVKKLGKKLR